MSESMEMLNWNKSESLTFINNYVHMMPEEHMFMVAWW